VTQLNAFLYRNYESCPNEQDLPQLAAELHLYPCGIMNAAALEKTTRKLLFVVSMLVVSQAHWLDVSLNAHGLSIAISVKALVQYLWR
jgi:hypothetical protein